MQQKLKKALVEWGVIGALFSILYVTGLHTEVAAFLQRAVLSTGIFNPEVEEKAANAAAPYPGADFNMHLINDRGERVSLEQFRGKVIFMNIWATWCPPCIAEMPGINSLYQAMADENVVFLMISTDEDFEKAKQFRQKKGFDFEIYRLEGGMPSMYATRSIPSTFVIDAQGSLALRHEGMADYDTQDFKQFLRTLQ